MGGRTTVVAGYQHGIYPRSEGVVAATRDLERGRTTPEVVAERFQRDREEFVGVQREAGLDYFSDGLLDWQDIFRPLVEASQGIEATTLVRWFDNNSFYRAPRVTEMPMLERAPGQSLRDDGELPRPRVASLPSPYMFSRAARTTKDRNALMRHLAREVLGPVVEALVARGYTLIHLQEPWLAYFGIEQSDWAELERALADVGDVAAGRAGIVLHTYFGDAGPWLDQLRQLPVQAIGIDFIETDPDSLGRDWEVGLVAGCLDARRSLMEPVDLTVRFALRLIEALQPPSLYLSSNSDLELLPRDVARQKVLRLGEVVSRLKEVLH